MFDMQLNSSSLTNKFEAESEYNINYSDNNTSVKESNDLTVK